MTCFLGKALDRRDERNELEEKISDERAQTVQKQVVNVKTAGDQKELHNLDGERQAKASQQAFVPFCFLEQKSGQKTNRREDEQVAKQVDVNDIDVQVVGFLPVIAATFFNKFAYRFEKGQIITWGKAVYTNSIIFKSLRAEKSNKKSQRDDDYLARAVDFFVYHGPYSTEQKEQSQRADQEKFVVIG